MTPADLLAECDARGIRLSPASGAGLTIDGPARALTPDLIARLKAAKLGLLALLRRALPAAHVDDGWTGESSAVPVCHCGSTSWRDVPIHGDQSLRRDCGRCGRFIGFPVWYGKDTLQSEQ